ncbi:MAG: hypothetical protein A3F16_06065 [Deltaproteobacteria bacterium RIFCSPHIGHO2_12_FULL_43_9]|nr:MAG: hypothetical protein A3F16_06065 [Deltaproteobacteria bacterium RIFCSPHIGHO2_12_FULL_43_9]
MARDMDGTQELSGAERDTLTEVVNICSGNASAALSQMINHIVHISVPDAVVDKVERVLPFLGEPEDVNTVVFLKLVGDTPGVMLLMFPPAMASTLAKMVTHGHTANFKELENLNRSALGEIGNILAGSATTALSAFLYMNVHQSIPEVATDMVGAVVDAILGEIGESSDVALAFKVNFDVDKEDIRGKVLFLFEPEATRKILNATKERVGSNRR